MACRIDAYDKIRQVQVPPSDFSYSAYIIAIPKSLLLGAGSVVNSVKLSNKMRSGSQLVVTHQTNP